MMKPIKKILTKSEVLFMVSDVRGAILQNVVFLEKSIDESISRYFSDNIEVRSDLLNFILCTERITFRSKVEVFKLIIDKEALKGNNKFFRFKNKFPNFNKDVIEDIIEERNIFAHYLLDSGEGFEDRFNKEGKIRFIKFKVTSTKPNPFFIEYDNNKIKEIHRKVKLYGDAILDLIEENY